MGTSIPKEGLRALIASLSGLPAAYILWAGEPVGPVSFAQDARRITLNATARRRVGEDEETRAYVADPANPPDGLLVQTTFSGQRSITISVVAEDFGIEEGFDTLETVRTLLGANENRATLNTFGCALASITDVTQIEANAGNRVISVATMDLILNQYVETIVTKSGDTYISSVAVEGDPDSDLAIAGSDVIESNT